VVVKGLGVGKGEVRTGARQAGRVRRAIAGVLGLRPGLLAWLPGEPGRVKRCGLWAWVVGAGWGALDAGG
jgi:hypothetical protein